MAKSSFINDFINEVKSSSSGLHAVTVVEMDSGMSLGSFSDGVLDPDIASAYNVEVVKSKLKAIDALGLKDSIDDILITLDSQYHLISCTSKGTHMIYLAADKAQSNLGMLRSVLKKGKAALENNL